MSELLHFKIDGVYYRTVEHGVIKQTDPEPFEYKDEYLDHYRNLDQKKNKQLQKIKLEFILRTAPTFVDSIFDFGYGDGSFLKEAVKGSKCYGYDTIGGELPDGVVRCVVTEAFWPPVDCVTMWDVLEHVENPRLLLETQNTKYLAISVPNFDGETVEEFKNWKHRKPDEHLWHFNLTSLIAFVESCGFQYLAHDNTQDEIRKPDNNTSTPNILQVMFRRS